MEQTHYDYFVAGKWRNRECIRGLARGIREKGRTAYCFLDATHNRHHQNVDPAEHMDRFEKLDWRSDAEVREAFEEDMDAERNSDAFVLLLPAGKSCHIEAGVAYGMGKKCILIGMPEQTESLYLIFHAWYPTVEEFLLSLEPSARRKRCEN